MNLLEKIRALPLKKRKIILWSAVILAGLIMFFFWARGVKGRFQSFDKEDFAKDLKIEELKTNLEKIK